MARKSPDPQFCRIACNLSCLALDRRPDIRSRPDELLRRLCARHLPLLQRRAAQGLPWVLSKVLQPKMLQQLDSGPMSEMLHRSYVYMTSGGKGVPDDLHLSLKDMKVWGRG